MNGDWRIDADISHARRSERSADCYYYPTAHARNPATVPNFAAGLRLAQACSLCGSKQRPRHMQKSTENRPKIINQSTSVQKSINNRPKLRFGGVVGGLGGCLGTILRPGAAPKAPESKKVTQSSLNPRSWALFGEGKSVIFRCFCDFCWPFL